MAKVARLIEERKKAKWIKAKKDNSHVPPPAGRGGGERGKASKEVVFKVVHWHKSQRSAGDTAAYIGRTRECDKDVPPEQVYNDVGKALKPEEIQTELDAWNLTPDRDNLSRKAREMDTPERFNLKEGERLGKRQSMHAILSFPNDGQMTREQVREVADKTFRETLGEAGHRYIYAVHDHGRPHVHLIVKVRSDGTGRQLRLGADEINKIREAAARNASLLAKANYRATRREDRPQTRQTVKEGKEELRVKDDYRKAKGHQPVKSWLHEKAPLWGDRHAAQYYERTTKGAGVSFSPPYPARLPPLSVRANKNLAEHFSRYEDHKAAQARFLEMMAENKSYAFWAANNRPELFGAMRDGASGSTVSLTPQMVPVSRAWQKESIKRIRDANEQELQKDPSRSKGRRDAVDSGREQKKASSTEKRRHRDGAIMAKDAPDREDSGQRGLAQKIMRMVGLGKDAPAAPDDNKPSKGPGLKTWTRTRATEKAVDQRMSELDGRQADHGQEKGRGR